MSSSVGTVLINIGTPSHVYGCHGSWPGSALSNSRPFGLSNSLRRRNRARPIVTDGAKAFPVVYRGIAPDTFTDGVDVVVEGRMGEDGTFHATVLLAKCASRYENAPEAPGAEKYKQTPGYKSGARA